MQSPDKSKTGCARWGCRWALVLGVGATIVAVAAAAVIVGSCLGARALLDRGPPAGMDPEVWSAVQTLTLHYRNEDLDSSICVAHSPSITWVRVQANWEWLRLAWTEEWGNLDADQHLSDLGEAVVLCEEFSQQQE